MFEQPITYREYLARLPPLRNRFERETFWRSYGFSLGSDGSLLEATCKIDGFVFVFYGGRANDYTYGRGVVSKMVDGSRAQVQRHKGNDYDIFGWFCSYSMNLSMKVIDNIRAQQSSSFSNPEPAPEQKRFKSLLYGKRYQALRERRTSTITASQFSFVKAVWRMTEEDMIKFNLSEAEAKSAKNLAEMILTDVNQRRVIYKGFSPIRQFPGNPGSKR